MRRILLGLVIAASASIAIARDTRSELPLRDIIESPTSKAEGVDGTVKFYLAGQSHPKELQSFGEDVTNKKTNGTNKSDEEACRWVAISALLSLQARAKELGANAVVDIVSYYKKSEFRSATNFECHSGGLMSGVALKGRFVKLAR